MASTRTSKTAGESNTDDGVPSGDVVPSVAVNGVEPDTSETSAEAAEPTEDAPKMADLVGIRYVGMANTRKISMLDLEALGVENPKQDLEWNADNGKVVPTEEINAATRDALLALPDFVVA